MPLLSFSGNLLQDAYIMFQERVDDFKTSKINTPYFGLVYSSPLKLLYI